MENGLTKAQQKQRDKLLQEQLEVIDESRGSMIEHAIKIGGALKVIKTELGHGDFLAFVAEHCGFKKSTAENYMLVHTELAKFPRVGNFDLTAAYALCGNEAAIEEAKTLANKVFRITVTKADEILQQVRTVEAQARVESARQSAGEASDEPQVSDVDEVDAPDCGAGMEDQGTGSDHRANQGSEAAERVLGGPSAAAEQDEADDGADTEGISDAAEPEEAEAPARPQEPNEIGLLLAAIRSDIEMRLDGAPGYMVQAAADDLERFIPELRRRVAA